VVGLCLSASFAQGGDNPDFTFPLHAKVTLFEPCDGYLPVDCRGNRPTVNVPPYSQIQVFFLVANYNNLAGVGTALEWDPSWTLQTSIWDCQVLPIALFMPTAPGGPEAGRLFIAFDCITGPELAVIGHLRYAVGPAGCLRHVTPSVPPRISVIDCQLREDEIDADDPVQRLRLGKICVDTGGHDACEPLTTAVESTTWGKVKSTYR
jgi:hypothetical protein